MDTIELIKKDSSKGHWGVYSVVGRNAVVVTCIHGGQDGTMTLQWNGRYTPVRPDNMRETLYVITGAIVDDSTTIVITPCFPVKVRSRYTIELRQHKIEIVGNHNETTWVYGLKQDPNYIAISRGNRLSIRKNQILEKPIVEYTLNDSKGGTNEIQ